VQHLIVFSTLGVTPSPNQLVTPRVEYNPYRVSFFIRTFFTIPYALRAKYPVRVQLPVVSFTLGVTPSPNQLVTPRVEYNPYRVSFFIRTFFTIPYALRAKYSVRVRLSVVSFTLGVTPSPNQLVTPRVKYNPYRVRFFIRTFFTIPYALRAKYSVRVQLQVVSFTLGVTPSPNQLVTPRVKYNPYGVSFFIRTFFTIPYALRANY
jgi:hypothetical protein